MSDPRPHVRVYQSTVPLWLVLAVIAPLGLVFLTSLLLAVVIAGAAASLAALFLPRLLSRRTSDRLRTDAPNTIELEPSQYRHIESRPPRDPE